MSPDYQPRILWQAYPPVGPDKLEITVLVHDPPNLPPEVREAIDETWVSKPRSKNGLLASLASVENHGSRLHLVTGLTDYKTQVGINVNYQDPRIQSHLDCLQFGCIVLSTLISTSDKFLVLGLRPKGNTAIPGIIGGTANHDESIGPLLNGGQYFKLITHEISEELGWNDQDIGLCAIGLVGLLVSPLTGRPLLLFDTHTPQSSQEVVQKFDCNGNKNEHRGLCLVSNTKEEVLNFLHQFPTDQTTTMATIDTLLFYLQYTLGHDNS